MKHLFVIAVVIASLVVAPYAQASCVLCACEQVPNATFNSASDWTWSNFAGGTNASWASQASACGYTIDSANMSPAGAWVYSASPFAAGTGNGTWSVQFTAYVPNYTSATIYDHIRIRVSDDLGRSEEFYAYFTNMSSCNYTFSFNLSNNYNGRNVEISLKKSQYSSMTTYVDNAMLFYYTC